MASKAIDHKLRKERILAIVVDHYVRTVSPVSSGFIAQEYFSDLSSATIRNILAELEHDGFLSHPHTSAGRVPTSLGYRYYVDHLMHEIELLENEKARIQSEYQQNVKELSVLLARTSQVLADLTNYTSIVSQDGGENVYCRGLSFVAGYPEFQNFTRIKQILNVLEEKERLLLLINRELDRKVEIFIGEEIHCEGADNCSLVISRYQKENGPSGRIAVLGPQRMDYERVVSALEYFSELMSKVL